MKVGKEVGGRQQEHGPSLPGDCSALFAKFAKFATSQLGLNGIALVIVAGVMSQGLTYVGGILTACVLTVALLNAMSTTGELQRPPVAAAPDANAEYLKNREPDPVRWSYLPSNGMAHVNAPAPQEAELENCSCKTLMLHRPTHKRKEVASGKYPYSWHMHGRKRLWEYRAQIRFKTIPQGRMYFGIELDYEVVPTNASPGRSKEIMLGLLRAAIGDFHFSPGDNPETPESWEDDECEPPTLALPMWAIDQFVVSDPGEEPDLAGDLEGLGYCRNAGVNAYIQEMSEMLRTISTEKVYTFAVWGISRFVDIIQWHFKSPFGPQDLYKFVGQGPLYVFLYEYKPEKADSVAAPAPGARSKAKKERHVPSRVRHYFKIAFWSLLRPPPAKKIADLAIPTSEESSDVASKRPTRPWYSTAEVREKVDLFFNNYMGLCWKRPARGKFAENASSLPAMRT